MVEPPAIPLPAEYAFLDAEKGPDILLNALRYFGVQERVDGKDNPLILGWAKALGCDHVYKDTSMAWCGLFAAMIARQSAETPPDHFLWALNWASFGDPAPKPMLGDVLVFKRFDSRGNMIGGHVGIYVGEDDTHFHVLGGNERDSVSIVPIARERLHRARRSRHISPQTNRRVIRIAHAGAVSTNEA